MKHFAFILIACLSALPAGAVEHVTYRHDGAEVRVSGRIEVEAKDGGLLLLSADGVLHAIQPDEIVERTHDDAPFQPLAADALGRQMLEKLPAGFKAHATAHYLILYNTSDAYADWCGALFERLYRAFTNFWSRKGFKLHEPEFPLVAVVFADQGAYARHVESELGVGVGAIVGYYHMQTNRVTMYDLTGMESLRAPGKSRGSAAQINQMLAQPAAEASVATIIHEATHQIAFNSGLQKRFADIPLWVSEGLAVYFETPDLQSAKGWRNIGAVNRPRLDRFRKYLESRAADSLPALVMDDRRFRDTRQALDAYAEAWSLNYYLLRQKPREYVAYLKMLGEKPAMVYDEPETRLKEFQAAFGNDLPKLDADLLRTIQKVR